MDLVYNGLVLSLGFVCGLGLGFFGHKKKYGNDCSLYFIRPSGIAAL